jgi:hypothetical protein
MTFQLKQLGPFRIEKSEDRGNDPDSSYSEMIRVKGSKPNPPSFTVPSHLYKHSEKEIGLYMKDHKNTWRTLKKILNEDIDISDTEIMVHFPISMFPKIAEIVPFVKKRGSGRFSPEASAKRDTMNAKRHTDKVRQNDRISGLRDVKGAITLDVFSMNKISGRE